MILPDYMEGVEARAGERECDCPPYVLYCVHVDGERVVLFDDDTVADLGHTCGGGYRPFDHSGFAVHQGSGEWVPCGRAPNCPILVVDYPCQLCRGFGTLEEAQAEFDRRAEALRQGAGA